MTPQEKLKEIKLIHLKAPNGQVLTIQQEAWLIARVEQLEGVLEQIKKRIKTYNDWPDYDDEMLGNLISSDLKEIFDIGPQVVSLKR